MAELREIQQIEEHLKKFGHLSQARVLAYSQKGAVKFPIYNISFGSQDPEAPVLGFVGGVHGLERIGSQVCISLMNTFAELLDWDPGMQEALKKMRVFFIPTVNPVGIHSKTRSNPRGVDLMRNAPVEAERAARWVGGHRFSSMIPWYRGAEGAPMEIESAALVEAVESEIQKSRSAIVLDIHSGFGFEDRLWFPYAKTTTPFPDLPLAYSLKSLLDRTYPYHFYRFEPQAQSYTTHGDLWDYMYDRHKVRNPHGQFLPLCLEMGSWLWVRKNPWQIFSSLGPFNPIKTHRQRRVLRRHNTLMEFLIRATAGASSWTPQDEGQRAHWESQAKELWYGK